MGLFERENPDEDKQTMAEQLEERQSPSKVSRTSEGSCDSCGTSEGSYVFDKDQGWRLCRSCYNDPEILSKYADG